MDLAALKAELAAGHPVTGAYSADNETAAGQINAVNRTDQATSISGSAIFNAIVPAEFDSLLPAVQARVRDVWGLGDSIDVRAGTNARAVLLAAFGVETQTRTNLVAAVTVPASRGQELGLGLVTPSNVADARRLP